MVEFNTMAATGEPFFVIFSGAFDENGESWCIHTNQARPYIEKFLYKIDGKYQTVEASVTRGEWKGNSDHPYRQAPFQV